MLMTMTQFGTLKTVLLAISLSTVLVSCDVVPEFPEVWQCQYNGSPRGFYCINTRTRSKRYIEASDERMKAAQCLSADDYKAAEAWVATVKEIAERRCK